MRIRRRRGPVVRDGEWDDTDALYSSSQVKWAWESPTLRPRCVLPCFLPFSRFSRLFSSICDLVLASVRVPVVY